MDSNLKRYEEFGWDYEYQNPISEKEIAWYLTYARQTKGPVLELACGSGRLLSELARAGFDVEGLELSPVMLKITLDRIAHLPSETASRIHLHNIDMTNFELAKRFGLIIIADNSFSVLSTREQQLSCLQQIHHHLLSDGRLLITVRLIKPSHFPDGKRTFGWSKPVRNPSTGEHVTRRGEMELVDNGKRLKGTFYYKTTSIDGSETITEFPYETLVLSKEDYIALLSEAGFQADTYFDYEKQTDNDDNQVLCFVCYKS